ncbi:cell division protein FtsK [Frankia sp. AgB1.9]|uniref:FtsK/SpoIIIE domain-containing protein n=1 Tax=unclassified Frankia TaxID=2632575 RepID=UPI001933A12A|nr:MULTISPECIES: FtsK/SpoIIIE domain-containing protein [unclassified Frankia]MBL7490572.1 cell division protein FtsK [Frankia sp. AgW1.1]MBL7546594.1 cell division protein FtsK [Frankia sp. AgB1.9]MBL7622977.1 cell division protein FtsK [Frankia sp. AgB1.8]
MRVTLTAVDPLRRVGADVLVDTDDDATVGEVGWALAGCLRPGAGSDAPADAVGGADPWAVFVHGRAVDPGLSLRRSPLVEGSLVSLGSPAGCAPSGEPVGLIEIRVVGGPGAGVVHRLGPGQFLVGTGRDCAVRLVDPTVTDAALTLVVGADGSCAVRPAGVGAGFDEVLLDGLLLRAAGQLLTLPGAEPDTVEGGQSRGGVRAAPLVAVGAVLLAVALPEPPDLATRPAKEGRWLEMNRPPRLSASRPTARYRLPACPERPERHPVGVLMALVPAAGAAAMAFVLHTYYGLLFALLTPLGIVGARLSGGRRTRKTYRRALAHHRSELAEVERAVTAGLAAECAARRAAAPDPADLLLTAVGPRRRLWERRRTDDDYLRLRLGTADLPSELTTLDPSAPEDRREERRTAPDVPVTVALAERGVLGLAGGGAFPRVLGCWLLAQAAVLHSPRDLVVYLLTSSGGEADWGWVRWLPHARAADDATVLVGADEESRAGRIGELVRLIVDRGADRGSHRDGSPAGEPDVLVLLDGARSLRALPGLVTVLRDGPAVGVYSVCLDHDVRLLPAECQAVVEQSAGGLRISEAGGASVEDVRPDLIGTAGMDPATQGLGSPAVADAAAWCGQVARALAPLRDPRGDRDEAALPESTRLMDLLDLDSPTAAAIAAGWAAAPGGRMSVPIGSGREGPFTLDLCRDGPHGLIAGTTGSGKSELLQSIVASLAVANPPDALTFVLVDYKGGAAFAACAQLPHCVGLVTDLDSHLVTRALTSLGAELRRRERLLAGVGAKDHETYQRELARTAVDDTPPRLPRLVIVIDEFASLARDLPDFVTGLVGLAQRGRSLGVHLLLATQRPGGVVSPEIRANTNLRIALRMTDAAESIDVIDAPDAARISRAAPGRALARLGHTSLVPFQAGRVSGRAAPSSSPASPVQLGDQAGPATGSRPRRVPPRVTELPWAALGAPPGPLSGPAAADEDGACDLTVLVEQIRAAGALAGVPRQRAPWLPPLPERITLDTLLDERPDLSTPTGLAPVLLGLSDLPGEQEQRPYQVDLESPGHLMIVGSARSGRSTALRTFAGALASRVSTSDAHLYGVDCGNNALRALAALPHTGAVVSADEPDRVERLLRRLGAEIAARQEAFAGRGYADLGEQRAAEPGAALPYLIVLLDRYEGFLAAFDTLDGGRLVDELARLIREGPAAGLRVVLTTDRRGLIGQVASAIENRLVLRLADRADYPLVGLSSGAVLDGLPPGRGFRIGDAATESGLAGNTHGAVSPPVETQLALLDPDPSGRAQVAALIRLGAAAAVRDGLAPELATGPRTDPRRPMRIDLLPARLTFGEAMALTTAPDTTPAASTAPPSPPRPLVGLVGVGGDELTALSVDLTADGPGFTIAGPPGSGRSTALVNLAWTLLLGGTRLVLVTSRPSPLHGLADAARVLGCLDADASPDDLARLLPASRGNHEPTAVVIDDAELLADGPLAAPVGAFLRTARDRRAALVVAGTTEELLGQFRGFLLDARRGQSGLLLWPGGPGDGELFGRRLSAWAGGPRRPGRGLFFRRGTATQVQVPEPPGPAVTEAHTRRTPRHDTPTLAPRRPLATQIGPASRRRSNTPTTSPVPHRIRPESDALVHAQTHPGTTRSPRTTKERP